MNQLVGIAVDQGLTTTSGRWLADRLLHIASYVQATLPLVVVKLDRLQSEELIMTQELIANMLGVRRKGLPKPLGNAKCRFD